LVELLCQVSCRQYCLEPEIGPIGPYNWGSDGSRKMLRDLNGNEIGARSLFFP